MTPASRVILRAARTESYTYISGRVHIKRGFGAGLMRWEERRRRRVLHLAAMFWPAYEFIGGHSLDIRDSPASA